MQFSCPKGVKTRVERKDSWLPTPKPLTLQAADQTKSTDISLLQMQNVQCLEGPLPQDKQALPAA